MKWLKAPKCPSKSQFSCTYVVVTLLAPHAGVVVLVVVTLLASHAVVVVLRTEQLLEAAGYTTRITRCCCCSSYRTVARGCMPHQQQTNSEVCRQQVEDVVQHVHPNGLQQHG